MVTNTPERLVSSSGSTAQPQYAAPVKIETGGKVIDPFGMPSLNFADFDGDGDEDLICGNTAGYVGFIESLDGGNPPKWAAPKCLEADGKIIRIMAGENGSIQGPCEAKWGYANLNAADWDRDGKLDLLVNSRNVNWMKNVSEKPGEWVFQDMGMTAQQILAGHSTTPAVVEWDKNGIPDLLIGAEDGYLYFLANPSKSR